MTNITPGLRINEHVLDLRIGGGAFGEVWRAHHHLWQEHKAHLVAFKFPTNADYLRNLQQEGAAIRDLFHSNIVQAKGFDPFHDPPYLMMEYVPGTSLRALIRKGGLPPEQAVAILRQVLAGLAHAASKNVIHRDIKPENILVHERTGTEGFGVEGLVKVTDFGLGRAATAVAAESILMSRKLTRDDHIAGTLDYMAPEQRDGPDVDARADLYACGVVLFELLTGERPIGHDLPTDRNPRVPKYLDDVFRGAYARLDKRFASAEEFSRALVPPIPTSAPGVSAPRAASFKPIENKVGMTFILIRPGEFMMGSPASENGRFDDEVQHQVKITQPFMMATTPVTQAQWYAVMQTDPSYFKGDDLPVEQVDWNDAVDFCRKLSAKEKKQYRLPTEAEWEYGCRAGTTTAYYTGDAESALDEAGWYHGNSDRKTHPVGQKKPNAWGLYDMHGNVLQWCQDVYGDYPAGAVSDPRGAKPNNESSRVLRGGSWYDAPQNCRSADRDGCASGGRYDGVGFRLCLDFE